MSITWYIEDWAGNVMFNEKAFSCFDDAEEYLSEFLGDSYEETRQEYHITHAVAMSST